MKKQNDDNKDKLEKLTLIKPELIIFKTFYII